MSSSDLLICRILNFEVQILFFSAPQNQFKAEKKRVLLVNGFFVSPIRNFLTQLKEKENKYYVIFMLQNSKFGKSPDDIHTTQDSKSISSSQLESLQLTSQFKICKWPTSSVDTSIVWTK